MEYVYAALLLYKLDKKINEESVKKVIKAAGVEPDEVKVKALVSALSEINIDEALKSAFTPIAPPTVTPTPTAPPEKEKPLEKKEEKKEEKEKKKEEESLEGLSTLFG
ncbi:MAG: 50S ribosomal protein P1 [archaeon]|nr:50S ribosomal protein P1 [archaeon]MCP8321705.1 50S ribosomal protein P1 [archaeon]